MGRCCMRSGVRWTTPKGTNGTTAAHWSRMIDRPDGIDPFDTIDIEAAGDTDKPDHVDRADGRLATACVVYHGPGIDPAAFRISRDLVGTASAAKRSREDGQAYRPHPRRR